MERLTLDDVRINSDLWPVLFFSSISSWRSRVEGGSLWVTGILSILVFLALFLTYSPLKSGLYVAGFTGAGTQIMLIMVLQSMYGFAYMVAPVMITLFMAGIVAGTLTWKSIWRRPSLSKYTGLLWTMAVLVAVAVVILKTEQLFTHRFTGQLILGLLNFIPGVIVGSIYGMSLALLREEGTAGIGRLFSADLTGAALGSFVPALFILPLIGVANTFILFCGINVATGLYVLTRWRRR
jgi:predicted membrane-bound spermidine synthase